MSLLDSAHDLPQGRLIALDLGQARIGVAVSDATGTLASPLKVLRRRATRAADYACIAELVACERAAGVLVGLPMDDAGQSQARWVQRYAGRLAGMLSVPVAFWDESLSTVEAAHRVREARSRSAIDAAAAAVLLADFLEARGLSRA